MRGANGEGCPLRAGGGAPRCVGRPRLFPANQRPRQAVRLRDGRRTQTVTLRQLDDAIAGLATSVMQARVAGEDIAERLADLAAQAETMADIASALADERGDDTGADMQF